MKGGLHTLTNSKKKLISDFIFSQILGKIHLSIFYYYPEIYLTPTKENIGNPETSDRDQIRDYFLIISDRVFDIVSEEKLPVEYAKLRFFLEYLFLLNIQSYQLTADGVDLMIQFLEESLLAEISDKDSNKNLLWQFSKKLIESLIEKPKQSRTEFFSTTYAYVLNCMKNKASAGGGN